MSCTMPPVRPAASPLAPSRAIAIFARSDDRDDDPRPETAAWMREARRFRSARHETDAANATRTAIIIDDDASIRSLVRGVLALAAANVVGEAMNGKTGIELAARHQPDLIVLDIDMPLMDGVEAYPLLRMAAPGARIVVFSIDEPHIELRDAIYVPKGSPVTALLAALSR